ncbi:U4/U6-associated splicing factor PRP4 [Handroanthus impetiginosus]|uniref:Serine/threonine-protein kinase PRP4 homolog n=1 Tax=Handroanthus impetiginosus TaxID=429701 RepID=A0A2G9GKW7_9LAMI|nr:U4/U6-associated splicing factor PRP4 [Handroanthus impetiginosus]
MASDSSEPPRRKHHRSSSTDDAEERSKRRKHRHHRHRHHHHHRHRSNRDKEETTEITTEELGNEKVDGIEVEEKKLERDGDERRDASGEVLVPNGSGFVGVDYEMEEGEIVEEDGLVDFVNEDSKKSKKNFHSDVESGEIETNGYEDSSMGANEGNVDRSDKKIRKLGKDSIDSKESGEMDPEKFSNFAGLENGDHAKKHQKVDSRLLNEDGKRTGDFVDEVEQRSLRNSLSPERRPRAISRSHSHEKYIKESSHSNLSKSPEWARGRSRSRSIVREASVEDRHYRERKHPSDSDDERMITHAKSYRHSSRDDAKKKERERSSSRYNERAERHYGRDTRDVYREGSRERGWGLDRGRSREKEREEEMERERERNRLRDRYRGDREWEMLKDRSRDRDKERERDRDWERERGRERKRERDREREREEKNKGRDNREGVRDGRRDRSRDKDRDSRRQKYDKGEDNYRDRYNDLRHRRHSEDYHRERQRKSDLENVSPKDKQEDQGDGDFEREDDIQEDYQEKIALQLAEQEEDDLERIKEESRRRRQAILEKYKNQNQHNQTQSQNMAEDQVGQSSAQVASAEIMQEKTDNRLEGTDLYVPEPSFSVGKSPSQNGLSDFQKSAGTGGLGEGTPKSERSDDMFCDDIFGESPAGVRKAGKGDGIAVEKSGLHDNWDDAEGYYGYRFGEVLDGRYEIIAAHGKGVFSTVVRAKDLKAKPGDPEEVAIKIIRNNETMYKAGMEELVILKKLVGADPENKRHCVRFLSTFKYRNHLCLVFESLHMNLREVLKKFGRNIGLKLTAVRAYAKQLFIALKHLKNCGVLHCDIKPDNMLVNEAKNVLKLCDFGNAMFAGKNEITPYLVSRFYRAPEIILGLPYDHPLDIWSVGCCLFELYTGKVLFPGPTNNDMLRLHMELKGPFPKKMLRKGAFTDQHFDQDLNFLATEDDPVSKKVIRRLIVNIKPKDFGTLISGSPGEDPKMVANFKDLMEKIFVLDPDKRLTVSQALSHPFITGK